LGAVRLIYQLQLFIAVAPLAALFAPMLCSSLCGSDYQLQLFIAVAPLAALFASGGCAVRCAVRTTSSSCSLRLLLSRLFLPLGVVRFGLPAPVVHRVGLLPQSCVPSCRALRTTSSSCSLRSAPLAALFASWVVRCELPGPVVHRGLLRVDGAATYVCGILHLPNIRDSVTNVALAIGRAAGTAGLGSTPLVTY
jgi:hypothetical protein